MRYPIWHVVSKARITVDLLTGELDENFFSRSGPVNWSCDSKTLNYFLWDYVKAHAYTDKPPSIDSVQDNIEAFIRKIPAEMLDRVCQNWTKRGDKLEVVVV